jgi:cytochrome c peroxidase
MSRNSEALTLVLALVLGSTGAAEARAADHNAADCPAHLAFLQSSCGEWLAHVLPEHLPPARGNAVADNEAAAALGMRIFYDNRFSKPGSGVACANCHDPEHAFAEKRARSNTIREVARNAPDLIDAAWYARAHFWDGKVDNLWSAPLFTFEQPDEMGSSRLRVVHSAAIYKIRYEKVFGPMPDLSDATRFPAEGQPGTPQFDAMSRQDKELVNRMYTNVGKALEAYIRRLAAGRAPFDDFMNGSAKSLSSEAQRGMVVFALHGCNKCHSGPTFSDEGFHDLGYPTTPGRAKDAARAGGITFAAHWPFTSTSEFADPGGADADLRKVADVRGDRKGFRTPSLRNVALTYPYGHDGAFDTLESAIDAHSRVLSGRSTLDAQEKHDIVEFLRALTGRPPQPPWNYWPGG